VQLRAGADTYKTLVLDTTGSPPQNNSYVTHTPPYDRDQTRGEGAYPKQAVYSNETFQRTPYRAYGNTTNSASGKVSYYNGEFRPSVFEDDQGWGGHDHLGDSLTPSHSADGPTDVHIDSFSQGHISQPAFLPRMCKRTIALCGLPSYTTLGDVTSAVRGGQLLDVYLRSTDHTALVSFVREEDASQSYEHARKNGIYIKNKRVRRP